jgi:hypothetical protein
MGHAGRSRTERRRMLGRLVRSGVVTWIAAALFLFALKPSFVTAPWAVVTAATAPLLSFGLPIFAVAGSGSSLVLSLVPVLIFVLIVVVLMARPNREGRGRVVLAHFLVSTWVAASVVLTAQILWGVAAAARY